MSQVPLNITDQEINDFLGNIELHVLTMKTFWPIHLNTSKETATRNAAKQKTIDAINNIQQILNTIESPIGITLPTTKMSDTEIVTLGIMPL
jgi:hypothetical protein